MARALARGWGHPLLCADPIDERAKSLAAEVGGEALATNAEVAERADLVVLCHKPAQLQAVAEEVAPHARAVASILAATPLQALRDAYPARPVYRFIPSLPVEVRQGAVVQAAANRAGGIGDGQDPALDAAVSELFAQLGTLVVLDDALVDVAMGLMSCAPAYVALVAEAQIDAGVRRGIPAAQGAELVVQTLAGTAELLRQRGYDTVAVRREVDLAGRAHRARGRRARARRAARSVQRRARRGLGRRDRVVAERPSRARSGSPMILASARTDVADFLSTLIYVYTLLIIAYIVTNLLFSVGLRIPYSRTSDSILGFLRDICEPFLRIFRRVIPAFGGIDFSPILAIFTLQIINSVVVGGIIHG